MLATLLLPFAFIAMLAPLSYKETYHRKMTWTETAILVALFMAGSAIFASYDPTATSHGPDFPASVAADDDRVTFLFWD